MNERKTLTLGREPVARPPKSEKWVCFAVWRNRPRRLHESYEKALEEARRLIATEGIDVSRVWICKVETVVRSAQMDRAERVKPNQEAGALGRALANTEKLGV